MGEFVAGIVQAQTTGKIPGMDQEKLQQNPGGKSFEKVLQDDPSQTNSSQGSQKVNQLDDPKLESMRQDLTERYKSLPEGMPKATALFPEYLGTKTQMSDFRKLFSQAVQSVEGSAQGTNVTGRFTQVENEWKSLEDIMHSNKSLSQGELLGLQARLYQVSQHIEVLSKVVDQMTSGIKTILNTNI